MVDADTVVSQFEDGGFLAEDGFVEIADLLLELLAVFAGLLEDVLQMGVLIDFDDDAALLGLIGLDIVFVAREGELKHVADDDVVMDESR